MSIGNNPLQQPERSDPTPEDQQAMVEAFQQAYPQFRNVPPLPPTPWGREDQPAVAAHVLAKRARDGAQYTRQQKGHSLTKHLLLGWIVLWIPAIYYTVSPNHYWHI